MECGNLVTVNDLCSPIPYVGCRNLVTVNDLRSPIFYLEYGNLVMGSPHMYNMICLWEPCNCQWLLWSPYTLYGMWEPCNHQWHLWSAHTLYEMWKPCNCQWLMVPLPYMELWEPCNGVSPTWVIWMQESCMSMTYGPPYLIWNAGTL